MSSTSPKSSAGHVSSRVLVATAVLLLVGGIAIAANALIVYRHADRVLTVLREITPGISSDREVQDLVNEQLLAKKPGCSVEDCTYESVFVNRWLYRLHIASPRGFNASVVVGRGIIKSTQVGLQGQGGRPGIAVFRYSCSKCVGDHQTYSVSFNVSGLGQPNYAVVRLAQDATKGEKERAYDIRLRKLCDLGNLTSGRDLAPRVWEDQPDYR